MIEIYLLVLVKLNPLCIKESSCGEFSTTHIALDCEQYNLTCILSKHIRMFITTTDMFPVSDTVFISRFLTLSLLVRVSGKSGTGSTVSWHRLTSSPLGRSQGGHYDTLLHVLQQPQLCSNTTHHQIHQRFHR